MRLHIKCSGNTELLEFEHQHKLTGVIHKWLGQNEEHGKLSLYCFSALKGGSVVKNKLTFKNGTSFFFSAYGNDLQKRLIMGIQEDPEMFNGISVKEVVLQETPEFSDNETFMVGSPVFIKKHIEDNLKHFTFKDSESGDLLVENLRKKMEEVGLEDDTLQISFLSDYQKAKEKLIKYRGVCNKASYCPVRIAGKPETIKFAWNVGLGNSTGIGFGSLI